MNNQSYIHNGYTLIELVVVIILLSILGAIALPKFIDFSSDAHRAILVQTEGAIKSAVKMVNAKAQMEGKASESVANISINGSNIKLNYGYPSTYQNSGLFESVNIGKVGMYGANSDNTQSDWVVQYIGREGRTGIDIGIGKLSKNGRNGSGVMPETTQCFIRYFVATVTLPAKVTAITDGC